MDKIIVRKLENFFGSGKRVSYKKDEIILRPADPLFGIFFIKEGLVRQYLISEEGEEINIHIFQPGSFFPIMLLIGQKPNRYYFAAETDTSSIRMDPDLVLEFVKNEPEVLFDLTRRFSEAIEGLSRRIERLLIGDTYVKVLSMIEYLAEKFGQNEKDQVKIVLPIKHNDLASWIGIKRETVSRQIEKLKEAGIVDQKNRIITILDKEKFSAEISKYYEH